MEDVELNQMPTNYLGGGLFETGDGQGYQVIAAVVGAVAGAAMGGLNNPAIGPDILNGRADIGRYIRNDQGIAKDYQALAGTNWRGAMADMWQGYLQVAKDEKLRNP
jgi:hypothetical protein